MSTEPKKESYEEMKAYALGIIARELNVSFDDELSTEQLAELNAIADDALLETPTTELGQKIKKVVEEEKAQSDNEYNKGFAFHKDLNHNKIDPTTVFILQMLGKYAERLIGNDETVQSDMLGELVSKMNELDFPVGYLESPFTKIISQISKLNAAMKGQLEHRKNEMEAYSVGIKHPIYGTLSPHLASFKQMDEGIKKLQDTFGFTEEDYRGKQE